MRNNLDVPLNVVVMTALTAEMRWQLEALPPSAEGSDKIVHFIAFAALAFPLTPTGRFWVDPRFHWRHYRAVTAHLQPQCRVK